MDTRWIFLIIALLISSCGTRSSSSLPDTDFFDLSGEKINLSDENSNAIRVFMFLTYDCPLSVNYTGPMNQLVSESSGKGVLSYFVFPGLAFPDDSVRSFVDRYRLEAPVVFDPEYKLSEELNATVTPQVIILDSNNNKVYSGAFDDWAFEPGRKRQVVSSHYVRDAVARLMKGEKPDPAVTEPVGCFIEF